MPKEFDNILDAVKKAFRKSHPEWDEKRVGDAAYGTATNVYKKKYGRNP